MADVQTTESTQDAKINLEDAVVEDTMNMSVLHDKLKAIQSNSLRKLLEKQNELLERISALSELPDMMEAERQRAILESDLSSVRAEYAKRNEQVGVLTNELFAMYDELGMEAIVAREDTEEDKKKRQDAKDAVTIVVKSIGNLEGQIAQAQKDEEDAKNQWWPIGKQAKIIASGEKISSLDEQILLEKEKLKKAQENIALVEEQIEVDKADRVRKSSVSEKIALIREFTKQTTNILKDEIDNTSIRIDQTTKALNSALTKKRNTARRLDKLRDEIKTLERDLVRERNALDEILDQGTSEYVEQQKVVTDLDLKMTEMKGSELKLNTTHMVMTQAVEANKSSLAGMTVQKDTAEVFLIKLSAAEKTAEVLGRNIDQMQKNTMHETASDTLDQVSDRVIFTTVTMGIEAEAASAEIRNKAIERHDNFMRQIFAARGAGDEAMSIHAEKYLKLDAKIRAGYKERGVDVDMSHLAVAANAFEANENPEKEQSEAVVY